MKRSKSSRRWLSEHVSDEFVRRAQKDGYRSRAVYKLIEIDEKDRLLRPGQVVLELGAAPGGWTQYLSQKVGAKGRVIASDILQMDPFADVLFIPGDFTEDAVYSEITAAVGENGVDLVLSDMAPNMSGVYAVDQPRSMYLAELTLNMAQEILKPAGNMLVKVFHGEYFDQYVKDLRSQFAKVSTRKPRASRDRSREVYLVATNFMGGTTTK